MSGILDKFKSSNIKQAFLSINEQLISSATIFFINLILARYLSKEEYGIYILSFNIIMIIIGFERALIATPYLILRQRNLISKIKYRNIMILFIVVFISFTIFVYGIYILYTCYFKKSCIFDFFISFLFLLIGHIFLYFIKNFLMAEFKFMLNFIYSLVNNLILIFLFLILLSLKVFKISFIFFFWGFLYIFSSLFIIFRFNFFYNKIKLKKDSIKYIFFEHWNLGKWIVGSNIAFMFSSQIVPWLLYVFHSTKLVADLGVTLAASRIIFPFMQGLWSFLLPKMSSYYNDISKLKKMLLKLVIILSVIAILFVILGYFFGKEIIVFLYSNKYENLGLAIFLGFILQGINIINMPIDTAINSLKKTNVGFFSLVASVITMLLFGIILIWKYELMGALIALIMSNLSSFLFKSLYLVLYFRGKDENSISK